MLNKPLKYCTLSLCLFLAAGCGADPDEGMTELLKQVDLEGWELYKNVVHSKDILVDNVKGTERISLFIDPRANMLGYTHTWE